MRADGHGNLWKFWNVCNSPIFVIFSCSLASFRSAVQFFTWKRPNCLFRGFILGIKERNSKRPKEKALVENSWNVWGQVEWRERHSECWHKNRRSLEASFWGVLQPLRSEQTLSPSLPAVPRAPPTVQVSQTTAGRGILCSDSAQTPWPHLV